MIHTETHNPNRDIESKQDSDYESAY